MESNSHTTDVVQTFPYIENSGLNLVILVAKLPNCMTVESHTTTKGTSCAQRVTYSSIEPLIAFLVNIAKTNCDLLTTEHFLFLQ